MGAGEGSIKTDMEEEKGFENNEHPKAKEASLIIPPTNENHIMELLRFGEILNSSTSTVLSLHGLVKKYSPNGLFLCETKSHKERLEKIRKNLDFMNCFVVNAEKNKRGMALLWDNNWNWTVISVSKWIIGVLVDLVAKGNWLLWLCHCPCESSLRKEFWEDLSLKVKASLPS